MHIMTQVLDRKPTKKQASTVKEVKQDLWLKN
jgi:hypothetical protein